MKDKLFYQGLFVLLFINIHRCENQVNNSTIENKELYRNAQTILHQGRIVSKPVSYFIFFYVWHARFSDKVLQAIPVDQIQDAGLQYDDINQAKQKFIAHGDILTPIDEESEHSELKR